jgi:hypothetical protein
MTCSFLGRPPLETVFAAADEQSVALALLG